MGKIPKILLKTRDGNAVVFGIKQHFDIKIQF
jgi:hypothetical protein